MIFLIKLKNGTEMTVKAKNTEDLKKGFPMRFVKSYKRL